MFLYIVLFTLASLFCMLFGSMVIPFPGYASVGATFPKFSPRLFELSSSTGWFVPSEVLNTMFDNSVEDVDPFPFLQEDVYHAEQPGKQFHYMSVV